MTLTNRLRPNSEERVKNRLARHQASVDAIKSSFPNVWHSFAADHDPTLVSAQIVDVIRHLRR